MLPLCDAIALLLENTYDIPRSVRPVGRFIIGEEGLRRCLAGREERESVDSPASHARLLLRRSDEGWNASLFIPEALVGCLERRDPRRAIDHFNVGSFATLIEEIDHLVTFSDRVCTAGADISLLQLETHAVVSQHLVLSHFLQRLQGGGPLQKAARRLVDHQLFEVGDLPVSGDGVDERYREARRRGRKLVACFSRMTPQARITFLRQFHRDPQLAA